MRILFFISYILISIPVLFSQQKTEAYFGVSNRVDYANNIMEMYDKGYYITGGFEGEKGWNIKTDINIDFLYDKTFEHTNGNIGWSSSTSDNNGNIFTCGYSTDLGQWPIVTMLDSCGEKQWCKILYYEDEFNYGWAQDILVNNNNEILILTILIADNQIEMIHVIGLNKNGDILWKKPYASRNDYSWIREPVGYSIKMIDDDYYISGYCYWPYPDDTTHFFLRPLFIGIDSLFNEKWILPFAPLDSVYGDAFNTIALNDSVLMGVGERWLDNNDKNTVLMFYNSNGKTLGYNQIPNDSIAPNLIANVSRDIKRINDSLFITFSVWGSAPNAGICSEMVINTSGKIYIINESEFCSGSGSLIKTFDNNFVYAVNVNETKSDWDIYVYKIDENLQDVPFDPTPHTYDSLCPGSIQSSTIDLTSCFIWTDISEVSSPGEYYASLQTIPIKAYPNPATDGSITFEFENTEHHSKMELKCFDIFGEEVHKEKVYRFQGESVVDIGKWRDGIYFGIVYSEGLPVGEVKFVVQ